MTIQKRQFTEGSTVTEPAGCQYCFRYICICPSAPKPPYSVVVRNSNSWTQNQDGSNREYEITAHCGHKHQSIATAQACKDKLTAWYCICGERSNAHWRRCSSSTGHTANSTSARWYHSQIEDQNGDPV